MLLDTNVVSELRKLRSTKGSPEVARWEATVSAPQLFLSVVTIEELEIGILQLERHDPRQAWALRQWLMDYVLVEFRHRILPVTTEIARRSAFLRFANSRTCEDALLAATAYVHNLPFVTRNVKHFTNTGIPLTNPWDF
jgi:predicted nucleic acid-binding protein